MGIAGLVVSGACLLVSSVLLAALARPRNSAETLMAAYLVGWAQVACIIQALSLLHDIGPLSVTIAHLIVLVLAMGVYRWVRPGAPPLAIWRDSVELWRSLRLPSLAKIVLVTWLGLILAATLYLSAMVPQSNADALAYHLSRAAHWLQNQSIAHYPTELIRQNEMPLNGELGILWTMVFVPGDLLSGVLAWLCWAPLAMACYGIVRGSGLSPTVSVLSVCTLASLPQIIFLSSSAENDMSAATLLVVGIYFLGEAFSRAEGAGWRTVLAALGIGLSLGTKGSAFLWGPGVLVLLIGGMSRIGGGWRRSVAFCGWVLVFAVLFAGYGWLENWRWFGNPFLSPEDIAWQRITDLDVATWTSNCLKNWGWFCEPMRVGEIVFGEGRLQRWTMAGLHWAHEYLGVDVSSPRTTFGHFEGRRYELPATPRLEWTGHLGPLGFLLFWPAAVATVAAGVVRMFWRARRESPTLDCALWAFAALFHFAVANALVTWRPGSGRLWVPLVCVGLPAIGWVYMQAGRLLIARWLTALFVGGLALGASLEAALQTPRAPLLATQTEGSVFLRSRADLRREMLAQRWLFSSLMVDSLVPEDATIGLALGQWSLDFLMFGPKLTRRCVPLTPADLGKGDVLAVMNGHKLDALLVDRPGQPEGREPIITRRVIPGGVTVFEWGGGALAVRAPLPDTRIPWGIREK